MDQTHVAHKKKQTFFPTEPQHVAERTERIPTEAIPLKALTARQRFYIKALQQGNAPYVVAHGPAGTGKTYLAVLHAINQLRADEIKKIIITRPMVGAGGEEIGFLPGDVTAKTAPWAIPVIDVFEECYTPAQVARMIETKVIELAPLALMRGRTLKNAIVIVDESQNTTIEQMQMVLTRLGEGSRMIITGDERQHDRGEGASGLGDLIRRLNSPDASDEYFSIHGFNKQDSVRHPAIESVLSLYA